MSEAIGFIGMDHMGTPMAKNLLAAGYTLHVYNRTLEKTASLVKLGATAASSPAELAKVCSTVISMVADDAALEQLVLGPHGLLQGLARGALHISMSTILPDTARRLAERHAEHGSAYVAAPVFGRPEAPPRQKNCGFAYRANRRPGSAPNPCCGRSVRACLILVRRPVLPMS